MSCLSNLQHERVTSDEQVLRDAMEQIDLIKLLMKESVS